MRIPVMVRSLQRCEALHWRTNLITLGNQEEVDAFVLMERSDGLNHRFGWGP